VDPDEVEGTEGRTVLETIDPAENYMRRALERFAGYGEAEAMVAYDGRRFSYTELVARTRGTAAWLWERGVRPGMTLAMLVTNTAESFFTQFAAHLLGCRTVFMARTTPWLLLAGVLDFVDADVFIYEVSQTGEAGRQMATAAAPRKVFAIGPDGLGPDLTDPPRVSELPFDLDSITTSPVSLFQTSGTTGVPKLARHGQRFFDAIERVAQFYQPPDRPIRHLLLAGTWHSGGLSAAWLTLCAGGSVVINWGFEIPDFLATLATERITSTNITPPILYLLLDDGRIDGVDLSSMYTMTISAAPFAPARLAEAVSRLGPIFNIAYGMTELPFIAALPQARPDPDHPERLASCGQPWGDVQVEIRDPLGNALPTGEIGEICVRSDLLTEGYFGRPELNAEAFVDGWFRTGDAGRLDGDGYLYIVDRLVDMIITTAGSSNIYSRPLEDVLAGHPEVSGAAVVGVPHDFMGEAIHAYVIRIPDATVTEAELRELVVTTLNEEWSPHEVEFIDAFPLTESGKVDKKQLRARYAEMHPPADAVSPSPA
jgi:fatty-acyl-CoA synthase